jgi:hypothetical protein
VAVAVLGVVDRDGKTDALRSQMFPAMRRF